MVTIGLLHPGAMGQSVGAALVARGHTVLWAREGRSDATRARAEQVDLEGVPGLADLVARSEAIVSICPPHAASAVLDEVLDAIPGQGFRGLFVDANAISPQRSAAQRARAEASGAAYLDGSLLGPPARSPGTTRLALSGVRAREVAAWFEGTNLEPLVLEGEPEAASALKVCYAAWTKGTAAVLVEVLGLARSLGVRDELFAEWARSLPELADVAERRAQRVAPKAWRFEGEMREIAATFSAAGLPAGFHEAAAEVYRRLAPLKESVEPSVESVLDHLDARE